MERRTPQRPNHNEQPPAGFNAGKQGKTTDFKLEIESNSWLRIGLSAKDLKKQFNNLFCHFGVVNLREAFHALDGNKAAGISGMTKRDYARKLDENLADLQNRLHKGTYRPMPKKRAFIPKANGKMRPLAISEFEDKLVEWVLAKILSSVYEPLFIRNSFGFRPRRSAQDAIKAAYLSLKDDKRPSVVEIDLASFFDTVSHRKLIKLLQLRVTDPRVQSLVSRFLTAGILEEEGKRVQPDAGTPQGGIMSPVLANVFLHYALDEWFLKNYASNGAIIVRYADDAVFIFEQEEQAKLFKDELKARLEKFGLKLNEDKSGIIRFGKTTGNVFHFLGFTFFWGKDHNATRRSLRVKTEKTKLAKKIQEYTDWIKEKRARFTTDELWEQTAAKLRGHYNYYGVQTNRPKLNHFYHSVVNSLFKWLNRRSQRKSFTWERFAKRLRYKPLPQPPLVSVLKPLIDRRVYAH
jgi:group II intron reverse transcriptase/maturase